MAEAKNFVANSVRLAKELAEAKEQLAGASYGSAEELKTVGVEVNKKLARFDADLNQTYIFCYKDAIDLIIKERPELNVDFFLADLNEYRAEKHIPLTPQDISLKEGMK